MHLAQWSLCSLISKIKHALKTDYVLKSNKISLLISHKNI